MGIALEDRLIFALDVPTVAEAKALVEKLDDSVNVFKIGLELFCSGGYFELSEWLLSRDKKIFADLKLYDIPATVGRAVARLSGQGYTFLTVHGDNAVMEAAAANKGPDMKILAVTVLTSANDAYLLEKGYQSSVEALVLKRAAKALEIGCDGVISSAVEAPRLKSQFGDQLLVVTPGIRPVGTASQDQKRVVTVEQAFKNGSDYIVIGRPVRDAVDPAQAAREIQNQIQAVFV
ncbi:MAG: orotidine-5'-phosphate decarboxylase [Magnetococcales bacterium]|nr:orotidine-5'-phosphate decarboxylase [Magnetococcales bacterium]